jgi:5-methylthioadenosine/S-adenosylhomocysteine deaminase
MFVETLLHAEWILPIEPNKTLEKHSIAIDNGRIVALLPTAQAMQEIQAKQQFSLPHTVLLPGLVNAHTHLAMNLLRGFADDLPLATWLKEHIWPTEAKFVDYEFVTIGSTWAMQELLLGGVTAFNDMYFFPDAVAKAASKVGLKASIGLLVIDFPTAWASSGDEYFSKAEALFADYQGHPYLRFTWAPHAPYTVAQENLQRIQNKNKTMHLPIHMHVHETALEVQDFYKQHGRRPLAALAALGLLNRQFLAVHMTQLTPSEIALSADSGLSVLHCPESNMKLASGSAPIAALLAAGVNVALGTDGAASNNDLDMFGEMRSAALLGKITAADAAVLSAEEVLRLATINGAKALGWEAEIGSLTVGKYADIVAVNLAHPALAPVYSPASALVYSATARDVSHVWVNGVLRVLHGRLQPFDPEFPALQAKVAAYRQAIKAAAFR